MTLADIQRKLNATTDVSETLKAVDAQAQDNSMTQQQLIQDAFDQLLHEQRVSNNGSIETVNQRDNSVECNLSNGWMVERIHFTSYSTGLPIVASTSVCLYDSKGELVRETIFTHENKGA